MIIGTLADLLESVAEPILIYADLRSDIFQKDDTFQLVCGNTAEAPARRMPKLGWSGAEV